MGTVVQRRSSWLEAINPSVEGVCIAIHASKHVQNRDWYDKSASSTRGNVSQTSDHPLKRFNATTARTEQDEHRSAEIKQIDFLEHPFEVGQFMLVPLPLRQAARARQRTACQQRWAVSPLAAQARTTTRRTTPT